MRASRVLAQSLLRASAIGSGGRPKKARPNFPGRGRGPPARIPLKRRNRRCPTRPPSPRLFHRFARAELRTTPCPRAPGNLGRDGLNGFQKVKSSTTDPRSPGNFARECSATAARGPSCVKIIPLSHLVIALLFLAGWGVSGFRGVPK